MQSRHLVYITDVTFDDIEKGQRAYRFGKRRGQTQLTASKFSRPAMIEFTKNTQLKNDRIDFLTFSSAPPDLSTRSLNVSIYD